MPSRQLRTAAGIGLISALSFLVYWPALQGGFVFDDDVLLTESKLVHASDGLYKFWFTTEPIDYWPITNSSFWIQWRLWGDNPTGYHVTNLVLHIADALLVWAVLHVLQIPYAFVAALLFAVHPVNVQSVAWIAQHKNVFSMFFFLLSLLCYLWSDATLHTNETARSHKSLDSKRDAVWYLLSLVSFVSAMLCKGSVAVLPLLLILIVWWRRGRLTRRDFVRTIPFFLVAALFTAVNIWFRGHGAVESARDATLIERFLAAGAVVWFYLGKAMLPLNLSFVYPQWHVSDHWLWWLPLLAVLLTTAVLWSQRHRPAGSELFLAWACFCVALLPVMGFIDVGYMNYSLVADHYQYLAIIPLLALVAAGLSAFARRFFSHATIAATSCTLVLVLVLSLLTWRQSSLYAGQLTLYTDAVQKNPESSLVHNNLAVALAATGQLDQALDHCREAVRLNPHYAEALANLGILFEKSGSVQESISPLEQSLSLQPNSAKAQGTLATVLIELNRFSEALPHAQSAVQLDPENSEAHNACGIAFANIGRMSDALQQFQLAIQLSPRDQVAHFNCGNALLQLHRTDDAVHQFQEAVRIDPNYLDAWAGLSNAFAHAGHRDDAIQAAEKTISLARNMNQPDFAESMESWLKNYRAATSKQN